MPKFNTTTQDLEQHKLPTGSYGFSATKLDVLGATEYTLATIILDSSGSVSGFKDDLVKTVKEIINACKLSPRADNLMIRLVTFSDQLTEIHGFKLLTDCNLTDYDNFLTPYGSTALFDAAYNGIDATVNYSSTLKKGDFDANGIVFVITDGDDNASGRTKNEVKKILAAAIKDETLESLMTILIGVNVTDSGCLQFLQDFQKDAGFTQYVDLGNATKNKLAKLAEFVSKSISAQSAALGTGGNSQSLTI
jgi:uncharacterized protein YegL